MHNVNHNPFKAKPLADDSMDADTTLNKPVPGHPLYPGIPAPANARLSLGQGTSEPHGQSTTIRLVGAGSTYVRKEENQPETPQLRPFDTAFDLVAGTPGVGGGGNVWPVSPTPRTANIYPSLNAEMSDKEDMDVPGAFPVLKFTVTSPTKAGHDEALPPQPSPFIFGSPLPQNNLSNSQFSSAAATVLEEMNKRLVAAGVDGVGMDILKRKRMSDAGLLSVEEGTSGGRNPRGGGATAKFEKMHEGVFEKMEGIDRHYAARRVCPDKAKGLGASGEAKKVIGTKRKSDAMGLGKGVSKRIVSGARVISNGVRRKMVPASFRDNDEPAGVDEEETELGIEVSGRRSKRPRFETGKSVSIAPLPSTSDGTGDETQQDRDREAKRLLKEREAIKRKLEMNKQKRRSSMGRPSLGGRGFVATQKAKGQTSRFGFLSSAKSLVQSVWNKGAGTTRSKGPGIPVSRPTFGFAPKKVAPSPAPTRSSVTTRSLSSATRIPPGGSTSSRSGSMLRPPTSASGSRSPRSPIPSFGTPGASTNSRAGSSSGGLRVLSTRPGIKTGSVGGSSRFGTRSISATSASSMGVRCGFSGVAGNSQVSSLGTKGRMASVNTGAGAGSMGLKRTASTISTNMSTRSRSSTSSRLFAPTASSLAKAQGNNMRLSPSKEQMSSMKSPGPSAISASQSFGSSKPALSQITNNVASTSPRSPPFRVVFSQPLSPSTPHQNPSLGAAAATLTQRNPVPMKAKVLPGRKPRISRSKVIAKLASQRAASGSSMSNAASGRTRSSMGAGKRQSVAGAKMARTGDGIMVSAKKRARQSEYARRRSRAAPVGSLRGGAMGVDDQ